MLQSVVKAEEKIDIRYFISSLPLGIAQFSRAVRKHWGIEITCYGSLDVTYGEDGLRTRQRTIADNLSWLRRSTLSLLKQNPGNDSLAMKRRICGWNDDVLMQVLVSMLFGVRWPWHLLSCRSVAAGVRSPYDGATSVLPQLKEQDHAKRDVEFVYHCFSLDNAVSTQIKVQILLRSRNAEKQIAPDGHD